MTTAPRLLYLNRVSSSTLTASATDTGYSADNLLSWREYELWVASGANSYTVKADYGSAIAATSFALGNHNLNTRGARVKLEASTDDFAASNVLIVDYITPSNDYAFARCFDSASYRYWRITIDNNGGANFSPQLGIFFVGTYLEMEYPPDATNLDPDGQEDIGEGLRSGSGYLLGSINDYTKRISTWNFSFLTVSWIENTWRPFWNSYRHQPFFWVWDYTGHQAECYLMSFQGAARWAAPYAGRVKRNLSFTLEGRKEE